MDMRVDSNRIRSERENRGWTQDHLGQVAGLSLRTIQRIEKTGSASPESVMALASAFSFEVADLRADRTESRRDRAIHLSLELPARLVLAVVSGVACALLFRWRSGAGWLDLEWLDFAIPGALFGAAVLCPYLRPGRGLTLRALALTGASALSYFCAVMTVLNADAWFPVAPVLMSYLLASLIGVSIVLVAASILIPLRTTGKFWLLGFAASLAGGVAMYAGFEVFGDTMATNIAGFCGWHILVCLAIFCGRSSHDAEHGMLAAFMRSRGRFSIVPGWMSLRHPAAA